MLGLSSLPLPDAAAWDELTDYLDPTRTRAVIAVTALLKSSGAVYALVEEGYVDRDYSAEYSFFWGRLFRAYRRRTRRFHFFRTDLKEALDGDPKGAARRLRECSDAGDYLGFVVQRPIAGAPISRAVLSPPWRTIEGTPSERTSPRLEVASDYEAHLLGATLRVRTAPFTQQDRSISSCAQVALWTCARHFHNRHGAPWLSMPEINAAALQPLDEISAQSLPAGSGGIDLNGMLRSLRATGQQPLSYIRPRNSPRVWPAELKPEAVIARYVDSGLPVVLVLQDERASKGSRGSSDLHAVVAVGMAIDWDRPRPKDRTTDPTTGDFVSCFVVHDDTTGPFVEMPVRPDAAAKVRYNVDRYTDAIIIPIPANVYLPAEVAEVRSRDLLSKHLDTWQDLRTEYGTPLGEDTVVMADAVHRRRGEMITRTYLTLGWKYKERFARSSAHTQLRRGIALIQLPRMLWVTEFIAPADLVTGKMEKGRVVGHVAVDATSSDFRRPPLVFHCMGFASFWGEDAVANGMDPFATDGGEHYMIPNDAPYPVKVRRT